MSLSTLLKQTEDIHKYDGNLTLKQILDGIKDYPNYKPSQIKKNIIINEPNLLLQPKYYQNTEFFEINPYQIVNC